MPDIWPITSLFVIALLVATPFLTFAWMPWRRQWSWTGLYLALCFAFSAWIQSGILIDQIAAIQSSNSAFRPGPALWTVTYTTALSGALLKPGRIWSAAIIVACAHLLFSAMIPVTHMFLSEGGSPNFFINRVPVGDWLGFGTMMAFAIIPASIGIPWALSRRNAGQPSLLDAAYSQLARIFGVGLVLLLILATAYLARTMIGAGPFSGIILKPAYSPPGWPIGLNLLIGLATASVLAGLWTLPRRFIEQLVILSENSLLIDSARLEDVVDPLWRPFARELDKRIADANRSALLLAEREAQLQAFFDNSPFVMFVTDLEGNFALSNNYVEEGEVGDLVKNQKAGGNQRDHATPEWNALTQEMEQMILETGEAQSRESTVETGAEPIPVRITRFPIRSANGNIDHFGAIVIPLTEQKRAEAALAKQQAHIHQSEKLAALGQLLAGVAHELNNPLTVVVGRSAILEEKLKDTPHAKAMADMREAADRCNRIVKTFLAMARQAAPRRAPVQVNDIIEAALDMVAYGLRSSGVTIERDFAADLPEVEADEDQLVQVFSNLLINAHHALEASDKPERRLRLSTRLDAGRIVALFADNGPGVPKTIATRIFEPFFTTKDVGKGTGMGLAMARGMIAEHGGTLTLEPGLDGGAMFQVALPCADAAAATRDSPAEPATARTSRKRGRALIVDDEASIRLLLADMLEDMDLESTQCADGGAALKQLAKGPFDIIFSDIRMPGIDGLQLRERLADDYPEMLPRLVFMSGDVLQRSAARREAISGHTIIEKPFRPDEVRTAALAVLESTGDVT